MNQKRYYGPDEILGISETLDGYQKLQLSSGKTVELSTKGVAECVTNEPQADLELLRSKRCFYVVEAILDLFLKENVNISDIDFIQRRVIMSINESFKAANKRLWGVDEQDQSFANVQRVLVPTPAQK